MSANKPASANEAIRTRHGGNVGVPFFLQPGQCEPEYDQGHSVVVWYDDLYCLAERTADLLAALKDLRAAFYLHNCDVTECGCDTSALAQRVDAAIKKAEDR